jgi:hypothetical protein
MGLPKKLMKTVVIVVILLGIVLSVAGAYGLAGGTVTAFVIGDRVVSAQEGGIIFSVVGIIVLLGGIAMFYIGFKPSRLNILSTVLGLCSFIIPAMFFGMGRYLGAIRDFNLAGGIAALVLGYSFLATLFIWLRRE